MSDYYLSSMAGGPASHYASGPQPTPPGESPLIEAIEARERADPRFARASGPARPGRGALPSRAAAWSQPADLPSGLPGGFAGAPDPAGEGEPEGADAFDAKIARLMSLPHRATKQPNPAMTVSATALYSDYSSQAMTSADTLRHEAYVHPSKGTAPPPAASSRAGPPFSFREFAPEKSQRSARDYV